MRSQGGTSIDISIEEEGEESGTPNKDREVTMAIAEEGAGASSATEHLPDTGLTDVQDKDKESDMEVTDQVVPVTEQVQEETVQDTQPDSSDTTKQPEEGDKIARVKQAGRRSTIQPIAEGAARSAASRPPPPPLLKRKSDPLLPVLTEVCEVSEYHGNDIMFNFIMVHEHGPKTQELFPLKHLPNYIYFHLHGR